MFAKLALPAILASAFLATAALADFKQVKSEDALRATLVGKKAYDKHGNWFRWNADGSMSGKLKSGKSFAGAWKWSGKYLCRNVAVGGEELGTDCQKIEVDGNQVRYTRKKGKGESAVLTIK
ncbi:hypothetical protein [Primorskyibacter sp. S87]|uniref:hypothetical protein n=1 Tax=Primorskyibacter sp. S87 TaxID=3415126 RepID=UPI003C7D6C33